MSEIDLNSLVQHRETLANLRVDGMTLEQIRDRVNELNNLEAQIRMVSQRQHIPSYHLGDVPNRAPGYKPAYNVFPRPRPRQRKERKSLSELNIGRKVMTVLAAGLCLLALGVFIASFWFYLPDQLKFLLFILIGVGLEALGVFRTNRSEDMRSFWLGIAGLGTGVIFITIAAGCLFWQMYGISLAGLLTLAWTASNFYLGRKQEAAMFYIIAYLGGTIALALGEMMVEYAAYGSIILMFLSAAIVGVGLVEYYRSRIGYLLWLNLAFCVFSAMLIREIDDMVISGLYTVALSALCLFNTRFIHVLERKLKQAPYMLATLVFCLFVGDCVSHIDISGMTRAVLFPCIVAAIYLKSRQGYLLSVALPWTVALIELSGTVCSPQTLGDCKALLPAIVSLLLCAVYHRLKDNLDRIAVWVLYLMSVGVCITPGAGASIVFYAVSWALIIVALVSWVRNAEYYEGYWNEPLEKLFVFLIAGVSFFTFAGLNLVPRALAVAAVTLSLQLYWFLYVRVIGEENLGLAQRVWGGLRVIAYGVTLVSTFHPDTLSKVILTLSLMVTLAFNVYRSVVYEDKGQSFVACLMANWQLFLLANMWNLAGYQMLISIAGLLTSAGFIVFGFVCDRKCARQAGLGCSILYALKMGLSDMQFGGIGVAGGLLLAGIICFSISFAYNKLGDRYSVLDDSEIDQ